MFEHAKFKGAEARCAEIGLHTPTADKSEEM